MTPTTPLRSAFAGRRADTPTDNLRSATISRVSFDLPDWLTSDQREQVAGRLNATFSAAVQDAQRARQTQAVTR